MKRTTTRRLAQGLAVSVLGVAAATAQAPGSAPGVAFPGQYAPPPADRKYPAWPKGCVRFAGEERTACLDAVAADFAGFFRYAAANALLAAPVPGEHRVVFFGDSITDNWSKPEYGGFFPGRPFINRGRPRPGGPEPVNLRVCRPQWVGKDDDAVAHAPH